MNAKVPTRCQQDWGGFGRVLPTSSLVPVTDDSGFGSAGHRWIVGRDRRGSASGGFSVGGSTPLKSWTGTVLASAPSDRPPTPPSLGVPFHQRNLPRVHVSPAPGSGPGPAPATIAPFLPGPRKAPTGTWKRPMRAWVGWLLPATAGCDPTNCGSSR
jgi:hypothetical protein